MIFFVVKIPLLHILASPFGNFIFLGIGKEKLRPPCHHIVLGKKPAVLSGQILLPDAVDIVFLWMAPVFIHL